MEHRDVVVIGAGLAGLSAAAHLAMDGHRPLVLEHHSVPGGFAHEFTRRGFRFEVALHALDGAGPGGWLYGMLKHLGSSRPHRPCSASIPSIACASPTSS